MKRLIFILICLAVCAGAYAQKYLEPEIISVYNNSQRRDSVTTADLHFLEKYIVEDSLANAADSVRYAYHYIMGIGLGNAAGDDNAKIAHHLSEAIKIFENGFGVPLLEKIYCYYFCGLNLKDTAASRAIESLNTGMGLTENFVENGDEKQLNLYVRFVDQLSRLYIETGKFGAAVNLCKDAFGKTSVFFKPDQFYPIQPYLSLAERYEEKELYRQSVAVYDDILKFIADNDAERLPIYLEVLWRKGNCAFKDKEYPVADIVKCFEDAVKCSRDNNIGYSGVLQNLYMAYLLNGDYEKANALRPAIITEVNKVKILLGDFYGYVYSSLISQAKQRMQAESADSLIENVGREILDMPLGNNGRSNIMVNRAVYRASRGRTDAALADLNNVSDLLSSLKVDYTGVLQNKYIINMKAGRYEDAYALESEIDSCLSANNVEKRYCYNWIFDKIINDLMEEKRYGDCLEFARRESARIEEYDVWNLLYLKGRLYDNSGDYKSSEECYLSLLDTYKIDEWTAENNITNVYKELYSMYCRSGQFDKAFALEPQLSSFYHKIGVDFAIFHSMAITHAVNAEDYEGVLKVIEGTKKHIMDLYGNSNDFHIDYLRLESGCLWKLNKYDEALKPGLNYLKLYEKEKRDINNEDYASTNGIVGRCYQKKGDKKKARKYLERARDIYTDVSGAPTEELLEALAELEEK